MELNFWNQESLADSNEQTAVVFVFEDFFEGLLGRVFIHLRDKFGDVTSDALFVRLLPNSQMGSHYLSR